MPGAAHVEVRLLHYLVGSLLGADPKTPNPSPQVALPGHVPIAVKTAVRRFKEINQIIVR